MGSSDDGWFACCAQPLSNTNVVPAPGLVAARVITSSPILRCAAAFQVSPIATYRVYSTSPPHIIAGSPQHHVTTRSRYAVVMSQKSDSNTASDNPTTAEHSSTLPIPSSSNAITCLSKTPRPVSWNSSLDDDVELGSSGVNTEEEGSNSGDAWISVSPEETSNLIGTYFQATSAAVLSRLQQLFGATTINAETQCSSTSDVVANSSPVRNSSLQNDSVAIKQPQNATNTADSISTTATSDAGQHLFSGDTPPSSPIVPHLSSGGETPHHSPAEDTAAPQKNETAASRTKFPLSAIAAPPQPIRAATTLPLVQAGLSKEQPESTVIDAVASGLNTQVDSIKALVDSTQVLFDSGEVSQQLSEMPSEARLCVAQNLPHRPGDSLEGLDGPSCRRRSSRFSKHRFGEAKSKAIFPAQEGGSGSNNKSESTDEAARIAKQKRLEHLRKVNEDFNKTHPMPSEDRNHESSPPPPLQQPSSPPPLISLDGVDRKPTMLDIRDEVDSLASFLSSTSLADSSDSDEDSQRNQPLLRSISLKTGKTPPGTPRRKKMVRFADAMGLELTLIKQIKGDLPSIPPSAYKYLKLDDEDSEATFAKPMNGGLNGPMPFSCDRPLRSYGTYVPLFTQPGSDPNFFNRLRQNKVCLESVVISGTAVHLVIRVVNVCFQKLVIARYTVNSWRSFHDLRAMYIADSSDNFSDRFQADFFLPCLEPKSRVEFCIRYCAGEDDYWDNNDGANYILEYQDGVALSGTDVSPFLTSTFF